MDSLLLWVVTLIQPNELHVIPAGSQGSLLTCIALILLVPSVHACLSLFPCCDPVTACLYYGGGAALRRTEQIGRVDGFVRYLNGDINSARNLRYWGRQLWALKMPEWHQRAVYTQVSRSPTVTD